MRPNAVGYSIEPRRLMSTGEKKLPQFVPAIARRAGVCRVGAAAFKLGQQLGYPRR